MKVEREIAGFSLPFAAGVALATYAGPSSYDIHIIIASVSLTAVSAALSLAIHLTRKERRDSGAPFIR